MSDKLMWKFLLGVLVLLFQSLLIFWMRNTVRKAIRLSASFESLKAADAKLQASAAKLEAADAELKAANERLKAACMDSKPPAAPREPVI